MPRSKERLVFVGRSEQKQHEASSNNKAEAEEQADV
jgi:hypothetical protein